MSGWEQYITNLTNQGITHAAIYGADGSRWAASQQFPTIENHKDMLPKVFTAQGSSLTVNGDKYIFIRNQDSFGVLRKGADAMVVIKLNSAFIISIGINQKPETVLGITTKIGDYLKNCGY